MGGNASLAECEPRLRNLFSSQPFMALATQGSSGPHASLLAFATTPDLRRLIFVTPRATRKFRNLVDQPRVSMLVDDRKDDSSAIEGVTVVTAVGLAKETDGDRRHSLLELYCRRHPALRSFAESDQSALFEVTILQYDIITGIHDRVTLKLE